jgi:hypothetical protein
MSDSDKAGGSDNIGSEAEFWAITPSFSTEGSSTAWFHADAEIESNNNGEGVALLSVSIDQGETWTPIWQMVEPQRPIKGVGQDPQIPGSEITDGYPVVGSASTTKTWDGVHGRWHVALPAEANNQPDVRIRMGWYEPADAWWYAVDNIVVDNNLPPQGSEVVLLEEFEAGIPDTWGNSALGSIDKITWATGPRRDPGGLLWKEAGGDGVHIDILRQAELMRESGLDIPDEALKSLTLSDFEEFPDLELLHPNAVLDGRFVNMLAGGNYAMWQPLFEDDEASDLDSPSLDLSDATEVFLDFDSEMLHRNGSGMYEVLVSVDGGSNFERIFTYQGALMNTGETAYFNHHYIPAPQAAGASSVVFRFHAEGGDIDRFEGFWVVDNVRVTKNTINSNPPATGDIKDGLVALWNFDNGDFADSVGAFHGEGNGTAAIQFAPGQPGFGQSIILDGVDQMVEIVGGEPDDLAFEGGSTSISAWFKVGAFDKSWQALVAKGEGSNWRIARRGGGNVMSYAGGIGDTADAGPDVNDGQWHHIVAVTDAEGVEFGGAVYIDGALASTTAGVPALAANGSRVIIGDNPGALGRNWNGEVDDVGIWNRALSASEIASIAGGDPIGGRAIPAPLVTDELVALWNFDGGDFTDSVGEFHGEGNGTEPIQFIPGRNGFGQALTLDGTDQMVEIVGGEPDDLAFEGGSVSIGAWFRVGAFDKSWQAMIAKGEGANWRIARRGGGNVMSYAGGIGDTNDAGPDINDGEWHHLLAVTDAEGEEFGGGIYIDGVLAASTAGVPALTANGSRVIIGDNPGSRGRNWNGDIDDVAIWGRALSASEVASLAAGGPIGGPVGPGVPPVGPPPVPGVPPIVLPPIPGQQPGSITGIARAVDGSVTIEYTGTLQAADSVTGPYAPVDGASSPYPINTAGTQFYIAR